MVADFGHSLLLGAMASLDAAPESKIHFPAPGVNLHPLYAIQSTFSTAIALLADHREHGLF